ncbi:MAG TPA: Hsp70 family protein [Vicinamibacteria bacterium]|nr:Hsp70 family protein [Vicinamibacteria bacterium]
MLLDAMDKWALDLGTTNTGLAHWDEASGQPHLVELPRICRKPRGDDRLEAPALVPSVVQLVPPASLLDRLGTWPPLERLLLLGRTALIGRPALERNQGLADPAFVPGFKVALSSEPLRPLARTGRRVVTARGAARAFLRELLAEVKRETGHRVRDLVVTTPVDAYEGYRAQLDELLRSVGVRRLRFLDEPLAAALGYGLGLASDRNVLVVDIGGGTMNVALVRIAAARLQQGRAEVLAKQGLPCGGNAVDSWILEHVSRRMGFALEEVSDQEEMRLWRRLMLAEACRVKEAVFVEPSAEFLLTPPGLSRRPRRGAPGAQPTQITRDDLVQVLRGGGFYAALSRSVEQVLAEAPMPAEGVDDILMVGGSTLLPGVFPLVEERFERHRVRAWQPFEAVALGAASFAADKYRQRDFIVHDYAFLTHDPRTHEPVYTVVVPRGTAFPTPPDLWRGQLVPTCSLGAPETLFKLVLCEIGRADGDGRRFVWDAAGDLHKVGGKAGSDGRVVVPLNEASPTLGHLDPPHSPRDRRPRLEISFGVDRDRWLVATVLDLQTRRILMDAQPVVRLQ